MNFIYTIKNQGDIAHLGGKAASLQALAQCGHVGINIPAWFALSPEAYTESLPFATRRALKSARTAQAITRITDNTHPSNAVMEAVMTAYDALAPNGEPVAVRSSAIDEDGARHSFAGQLESFLFVEREALADCIAKVWRSAFAPHVLDYRAQHGLSLIPRVPAVLIQKMINADTAGVAFSADPLSGRRSVTVINAVNGTAHDLVSGAVDGDSYRVDHHKGQTIGYPTSHHASALSEGDIINIAQLAQACTKYFGCPQDIEWTIDESGISLVQSRAITTLDALADPEDHMRLWDNSNIVESYGGITSPLTYAFARGAYEAVYREFARILGMPSAYIQREQQLFRNMLGYINGRVYYNLINWYRLLAMLPGFSINHKFMEQMMGVREGLPDDLIKKLESASLGARIKDSLLFARTIAGLLTNYFSLTKKTARFYKRLDDTLSDGDALNNMRIDALGAHYRELETRLLHHWDAPLINDLFAMIFYGLLHVLSERWCGAPLHNDLLCAQGGLVSAEPARRIRDMAQLAATDDKLTDAIDRIAKSSQSPDVTTAFAEWPKFQTQLGDYLHTFGERCLEELKLESDTTSDDPRLLLATIAGLAQHRASHGAPEATVELQLRAQAESKVRRALRWRPLRRFIFSRVLRAARRLVRERENLRFERTRVFGRVRRIVLAIGKGLVSANHIDNARDVFYLEINELLGVIEGTTTTTRLRDLINVRKRNQQDYEAARAPDERFQTFGAVHVGNRFVGAQSQAATVSGDSLQGIGSSPGVVEGIARVITDPRNASLAPGEILVAPRTDPGWVMLFAGAAGVLVERGSLLSHSAIVTRELGIPSIVALPGLVDWLNTGDHIRFDGATGVVERLNDEQLDDAPLERITQAAP